MLHCSITLCIAAALRVAARLTAGSARLITGCRLNKDITMAGLEETLARLAQLSRRLDGLLKSAAQHPARHLARLALAALARSPPSAAAPAVCMLVYTPKSLPRASALVVAFHGCAQTAAA